MTTSIITTHHTGTDAPSPVPAIVGWLKSQYALAILIVLLAIAALSTDTFFTTRNLTNLVLQVSVVGIVALAQLLIVLTSGIDISVGSVIGLSGVLAAGMFGGSSVPVAVAIAIGVGVLVGLVNGYLVAFRGLEAFIVTLGMMALARGLVYAYTEGSPVTPSAPNFRDVATTAFAGIPLIGIIWVLIAVFVWFIVNRTVFGRRVYALGSSRAAAAASGIPVKRTVLWVHVIAGVLVGLAGFLLAARVGAGTPTGGQNYELESIAAVVIGGASLVGGRGRVFGTVIGALIFAVISNLLVLLDVSTFMQDAFRGALIIVAVFLTTLQFRRVRRERAAAATPNTGSGGANSATLEQERS